MKQTNISEDTIVAISTPIGEGGIAIVRLSGPEALSMADKVFMSRDGKTVTGFRSYSVHYGHVMDKGKEGIRRVEKGRVVDEVILTVMKAPKSYTKEDVVEINCHGGVQAAKKVLELIVKNGGRIAEPGEFTKRAFLNGRIDLAQAEAVLDVIRAKTEGSLKVALGQLEGELSKNINAIREDILNVTAHLEAAIDFPEEDITVNEKKDITEKVSAATSSLKKLLDTYDEGMIMREGVLAIICGKPNVGKSSLMNLLLKRDRVIVSPIPGTTRDAVEEFINIKGIPIRLVDTAGIGRTKNVLDKEGIKRSKKYLKESDVVLLMLDGSTKVEKADLDIIKLIGDKKKIVLVNKSDLAKKIDDKVLEKLFKDDKIINISVEKKKNIEFVEKTISEMICGGDFIQGEAAIISNTRHKGLLDKSYKCMLKVLKALESEAGPELITIDLKEAIFNLGLVVGKSVSDDVLNRIFEQFCIGK